MHANVLGRIQDKAKLRANSNIFLQLENTSYIIFNVFFKSHFFKWKVDK